MTHKVDALSGFRIFRHCGSGRTASLIARKKFPHGRPNFDDDAPFLGVVKILDSVGRMDQLKAEWSVLELNEVSPSDSSSRGSQLNAEFAQGRGERPSVFRRSCDKVIRILGGIGEAKQHYA